jgi:hypothetical protein
MHRAADPQPPKRYRHSQAALLRWQRRAGKEPLSYKQHRPARTRGGYAAFFLVVEGAYIHSKGARTSAASTPIGPHARLFCLFVVCVGGGGGGGRPPQ